MLERYFVKPATIDRIRGSWIAAEIERTWPGWSSRVISTRSVWRRVPIAFAFGEFAGGRGASAVGDLPAHVEAFVADGVARHDARTGSTRPMAKEVRGPVEQLLSVVLDGFEPTGRAHQGQPFAAVVPGFFDYLLEERGLRPASLLGYRHHLDRFEAYLQRIGVGVDPGALTGDPGRLRRRARCVRGWPRARCAAVSVSCGCSCGTPGGKASSPPTWAPPSGGPRFTGSRASLGPSPGTRSTGSWPVSSAGPKRAGATTRSCCCWSPTGCVAGRSPRSPWTTSTGSANAWRSPSARPATRTAFPLSAVVGEALLDYLQHGRPATTDRHVFFRAAAPRRPIGAAAVSSLARSLPAQGGCRGRPAGISHPAPLGGAAPGRCRTST